MAKAFGDNKTQTSTATKLNAHLNDFNNQENEEGKAKWYLNALVLMSELYLYKQILKIKYGLEEYNQTPESKLVLRINTYLNTYIVNLQKKIHYRLDMEELNMIFKAITCFNLQAENSDHSLREVFIRDFISILLGYDNFFDDENI